MFYVKINHGEAEITLGEKPELEKDPDIHIYDDFRDVMAFAARRGVKMLAFMNLDEYPDEEIMNKRFFS